MKKTPTQQIQTSLPDLVDLRVDPSRLAELKRLANDLPEVILDPGRLCDFELLTTGVYSPLTGFLTQVDYEAVLDRMTLASGEIWPLPICLDIDATLAGGLEMGQSVALRDAEGFCLGMMEVEDLWPVDAEKEALAVYGSLNAEHPGVAELLARDGRYYLGGRIQAFSLPIHSDFIQHRNTPAEVRQQIAKLGWKRVVGYQTRQPLHRLQFEKTIQAMRQAKANLLFLPQVGLTQAGNFDHFTRMRCYQQVAGQYPPQTFLMNLLPQAVRLAGPREAVLHMRVGRNYGCTHFIINHNHACPGRDSQGEFFFPHGRAKELTEVASQGLGIEPIAFGEMVYLPQEDEFRSLDAVPGGSQTLSVSDEEIQNRVRRGKPVPEWATFPGVISELKKSYPSPENQGLTVFLTGLSGAGKSTIARVLYSRFLEVGTRPVTLLDGDIVRRNLSSELNFSKEHRDINVRRIGFVATEITKNRGIAICAPIAPYERTRRQIREAIEAHGGFFEVHVSTPITECEKRDRKGMYAKARAGLLKDFTGVNDPYEAPENPEIRIDTTDLTPDEAVQEILLLLSQQGFLGGSGKGGIHEA